MKLTPKQKREAEKAARRERFRASLINDPELLKDLTIGLQWAEPARWEAMAREK